MVRAAKSLFRLLRRWFLRFANVRGTQIVANPAALKQPEPEFSFIATLHERTEGLPLVSAFDLKLSCPFPSFLLFWSFFAHFQRNTASTAVSHLAQTIQLITGTSSFRGPARGAVTVASPVKAERERCYFPYAVRKYNPSHFTLWDVELF